MAFEKSTVTIFLCFNETQVWFLLKVDDFRLDFSRIALSGTLESS